MPRPTQDRLKEILDYNQETGVFTWKSRDVRSPQLVGTTAGVVDGRYITIGIKKVKYYAHRLAWFYVHSEWPKYIDHVNGNGTDNRLCNLRSCTMPQNQANRDRLAGGAEKHGRWYRARAKIGSVRIELGSFETKEEAQAVYHAFADKHYGEFARINREVF